MPNLDQDYATVLAVILRRLQESMITHGEDVPVTFSLQDLERQVNSDRNRKSTIESVLYALGGLRLCSELGTSSTRVCHLFKEERWSGLLGERTLSVMPGAECLELVTGYVDPYRDLGRFLDGRATTSALLGNAPPLSIWLPVWFDLTRNEQALFLRMEHAARTEENVLGLEDVFGERLTKFACSVPTRSRKNPKSQFKQSIETLVRLASKLRDHGFVQPALEGDYLAMPHQMRTGEPIVVWRTYDRLSDQEPNAFVQTTASTFLKRSVRNHEIFSTLSRFCEPDQTLRSAVSAADISMFDSEWLLIDGNAVVPCFSLFIEWSLRHNSEVWPIPGDACPYECRALLAGASAFPERLERFAKILRDQPYFNQHLGSIPFATLASNATRHHPDLSNRLHPVVTQVLDLKTTISESNKSLPSSGIPPSASYRISLKKRAIEELERMRLQSIDEYDALKTSYLASLDDESRRIILTVRQSMQVDLFERHLQQRLVRYMVENPYNWGSDAPSVH